MHKMCVQSFAGPLQAATGVVLCPEVAFHSLSLCFLALKFFAPILPRCFLNLRGCGINVLFRAKHSTVTSFQQLNHMSLSSLLFTAREAYESNAETSVCLWV